jgi:hypothetical protein
MTSRNKNRRTARRSRSRSSGNPLRTSRLLSIAMPILLLNAVGLAAILCLELIDPEALHPDSAEHAAFVARLAEILQHVERWK